MTYYPIELSVNELLARSREIAGVDIDDDEIVEPLTILHRAYAEEAQLDAEGAAHITNSLLRLLTNRLRMKRDFLAHPEIHEQPIRGPLVVMGVARSGTTKLQKVLASSGDFNFLPYWMNYSWASRTGEPNEPVEPRIADAEAHCAWYDRRSPETKLGHSFEALEPEEEAVLSEGCFVTPTFLGYAEIPSYAQWLGTQSPSIWFEFLRDTLKYLQWQGLASADKPWLLKSPNYNGLELEILKAFPDARLIMAHRSPLKTLTSMCKLVQCFRQAYSDLKPDLALIVEHNYHNLDGHLANRQAHPEMPLLDIRFEDIVGNLTSVIERIYADAGLALDGGSLARMLQWDRDNAMHKQGEFKYSLQELGLDETVIRSRMTNYFGLLDRLAGGGRMKGLFDLTGQIALVTGSTKGIGRGIAEVLCAQGAIVGISSRTLIDCDTAVQELNATYGEGSAFAAPADVSDLGQLQAMVDGAVALHGRIDILVCNAARLPAMEPFGAVLTEEFMAHYDTNVEKTLRLVQMVAPGMAKRGSGSVVLVSSRAGIAATPQHLAYSCSKAAMTHLSRNLAAHYAPRGVRINCLAPGLIRSDSSRAFLEAPASQAFIADVPLRRGGEAHEMGGAVAFLASAASGYITGATIPVDGGVVDLPTPPGNAASLFKQGAASGSA